MKKYKTIEGTDKIKVILSSLFLSFIFAAGFSLLAPWVFSWIAGFFDSTPEALRDCKFSDYSDKTLDEYIRCWKNSDSYAAKVRRLRHKIPWFWIAFISLGWMFLKNPLRGRIRDDSHDIIYEGEGWWDWVSFLLLYVLFHAAIWAFFVRDTLAFMVLAVIIAALILGYVLDRYFRKKYGKPRSEYAKEQADSEKV